MHDRAYLAREMPRVWSLVHSFSCASLVGISWNLDDASYLFISIYSL